MDYLIDGPETFSNVRSSAVDCPPREIDRNAVLDHASELRSLGRCDEADDILKPLLQPFPAHSDVLVQYARNAAARQDWQEAIRRWDAVATAHPDLRYEADLNTVLHLRDLKLVDDADMLISRLKQALPDDVEIMRQWCLNPHYSHSWSIAADRWEAFRARWPDNPAGYSWGSGALRELGRLDEASTLQDTVRDRFDEDIHFGMESALLLGRRGHWTEALQRWDALHAAHPAVTDIVALRERARLLASYARADEGASAPDLGIASVTTLQPAPAARRQRMSILFKPSALLLEFESLGSDCEVGLLQRLHGGEPLGLFRWGGPVIDNLITGLQREFADLGTPGTFRLESRGSEYLMYDDIYKFVMHTYIPVDPSREERISQQLGRRMAYLRRLLIAQIAAANRIFVFKDVLSSGLPTIRVLHQHMRRFGPSNLLVVQAARAGTRATDVEQIDDGLFIGYVSAFGNMPANPDGSWNIPVQEWITLFRVVYSAVN